MNKIIILLFMLSGVFLMADSTQPAGISETNIMKNGDFEKGTEGWSAYKGERDPNTGSRLKKHEEFISYCNDDGASEGKGCLKVDLSGIELFSCYPHMTGAYGYFKEQVPPDTRLKVSFYAKSLSGSRRLILSRFTGGGAAGPVLISDKWEKYVLYYKSAYNTPAFLFMIIGHYPAKGMVEPGVFLLDDIKVTVDK